MEMKYEIINLIMPRYCHKQWKLFGLQYSELLCLVVLWLSTNGLEEPATAVFSVAQFSNYRLLPNYAA
jgi:hypothetical protein